MPPWTANLTYPYWTIETARPSEFWRRKRKLLMAAQTRPECVGGWLREYIEAQPWDHTLRDIRVLEHPLAGISPLVVERPRGFIDYHRDPLAGLTYLPDLHAEAVYS